MTQTLQYLQQHWPPWALSTLRLAIWLILIAIILVPLERMWAVRKQKLARNGLLTDIAYYFLNNLLPGIVLAYPLYYLGMAVHRFLPYHVTLAIAAMPVWLQLLAAFLAAQIGAYWAHRWSHEVPFLWRFHAVHHSAEEMDFLVNSKAHPLDMVFTRLCGFIMIFLLGLAHPPTRAGDMLPIVIAIVGAYWGFLVHANLRWRFGPLEWLIATPAFHHWHHTRSDMTDRNYAATLPWLDMLFGTYYLPKNRWPERYGTDTPVSGNIAAQILDPILAINRDPRGSPAPARPNAA